MQMQSCPLKVMPRCSGTLTKGVMTAVRVWVGDELFRITGAGYDPVV